MRDSMDYITIIKTEKPCNKQVGVNSDGSLDKTPASVIYDGLARSKYVPDQDAMLALLEQVSVWNNVVIVLGYIPGTEGGEDYHIASKARLAKMLKVEKDDCPPGLHEIDGEQHATRTIGNFVPSSWILFDYDVVADMPKPLVFSHKDDWLKAMGEMLPGFHAAGKIIAPSTTGRILLDGKPAYSAPGLHLFMQVKDAGDIARFGCEMRLYPMSTSYGFMRPSRSHTTEEIISYMPWSIFDPSVFSPERLVYEGAPIVAGKGLTVGESQYESIPGGRIDTSRVVIDDEARAVIEKQTGRKVERDMVDNRSGYAMTDNRQLSLDTVIDTGKGEMTVADFWMSKHKHLRAQATFRPDSTSWAAFLGKHIDGTPFLFDTGAQTKYLLSETVTKSFQLKLAIDWVDNTDLSIVKLEWTDKTKDMSVVSQDEVLRSVQGKTGLRFQVLQRALSKANSKFEAELKRRRQNVARETHAAEGRKTVTWSAAELNPVVDAVKEGLKNHTRHGHVYNFGNVLTHVDIDSPKAVRQIQRKAQIEEEYPDTFIAAGFTQTTCMMRIMRSVAFLDAFGDPVGCPPRVAQALLDAPTFAKPLAGILEVPSVTLQGRLLDEQGYDESTGYFCSFDPSLASGINTNATKEDALEALEYISNVVFDDFPFGSDLDRSCAIAFLLTAFVRRFLDKAPGFMVTATTQASGKSTLVDVIFQAAFGRPAAASSWSDSQEEMRKHILALLMEGHSGVCFDNLPFGCRVDGDELAKLLTQEVYSARVLGGNTSAHMPTNILVALTGNQLTATNDMPSRLLPINLIPDVENPENTRYKRRDIGEWHGNNRQAIIEAVCTILIASYKTSEQVDIEPSRFPAWDLAVRKPMALLGLPDVLGAFNTNRNEDPTREARGKFLHAWHNSYGGQWIDLNSIIKEWGGLNHFSTNPSDKNRESVEFREALSELFPEGTPTAKHMGNYFRYIKNTVYGSLRLEQKPLSSKSKVARPWRVVPVIQRINGNENRVDRVDRVTCTSAKSGELTKEHEIQINTQPPENNRAETDPIDPIDPILS